MWLVIVVRERDEEQKKNLKKDLKKRIFKGNAKKYRTIDVGSVIK